MAYAYTDWPSSTSATIGYGDNPLDWSRPRSMTRTDSFDTSSSVTAYEAGYYEYNASDIISPISFADSEVPREQGFFHHDQAGTLTNNPEDMIEAAMTVATALIEGGETPEMTMITDDAVEEAMKLTSDTDGSPASAVRHILSNMLLELPLRDSDDLFHINAALVGAAYQIMKRVQGDKAGDLARYSLLGDLGRYRSPAAIAPMNQSDMFSLPPNLPSSTAKSSQKYTCDEPGCQHQTRGFNRSADLERHWNVAHVPRKTYACDYKKCPRHESPFNRADHFRDHLRDYHKEDIVQRSRKPDARFWQSRAPRAVFNGWWRCNRCFNRVDLQQHGFVCSCGSACESDRQEYRQDPRYEAGVVWYQRSRESWA